MSGGTTIIREAPRARRTGVLAAGAFVLPASSLRALTAPAIDELRLAARLYPVLVAGLCFAGALLWPATVVSLAFITPPTEALMRAQRTVSLDEVTVWYAIAGCSGGAVAGVLQWLLMRRALPGVAAWAPLTALSWGIGLAGSLRLASATTMWLRSVLYDGRFGFWSPPWERYVVLTLVGLGVGLCVGLTQWGALRLARTPLHRRGLWALASAVAWTGGMALVPTMPRLPDFLQRAGRLSGGMETMFPGLILAGAFYGLLTGFALTLLLRRAAPQPVET